MPDWQFGYCACADPRAYPVLAHQPFQQSIHGYPLPSGLAGEARFGFTGEFDTHGTAPFQIIAAADFTRFHWADVVKFPNKVQAACFARGVWPTYPASSHPA